MNEIDLLQTNSNENYDCVDQISISGINNCSESDSNINSVLNMFWTNNFNFKESEFNINPKDNSLISSENNNNKFYEKSGKNINNVNNLSNINIYTSNNLQSNSRQSNNNEILNSKKENEFVDKKRKRTVFIQNENVNNSSTNINENKICIPIEDSDANSEEESPINKKKGRKEDSDSIRKKNI